MSWRLIAAAVLLMGCGSTGVPQEAQAVRDLVVVSALERVDTIRLYRQLDYAYVNDFYLTVSIASRHYLVEFRRRCRALRKKTFTASMVDHRYDPSYLHAGDTIRGCPVERIYRATAEQLIEIKSLGKSQSTETAVPVES